MSSKICFLFPDARKYAIAYVHLSVNLQLVSSFTASRMNVDCAERTPVR